MGVHPAVARRHTPKAATARPGGSADRRHLRGQERPASWPRWARAASRRTGHDEPEPLPPLAGEGGDRHHHRPHRDGGRAQHRRHPDPARDGEAQGHRDPGVDGGLAGRDHAHLHAAGHGDRGGGDADRRRPGLGPLPLPRPLQADPRARGRLSDLVRAVHAAAAGRGDRDRGRDPHLFTGHDPSRTGRPDGSGRGLRYRWLRRPPSPPSTWSRATAPPPAMCRSWPG